MENNGDRSSSENESGGERLPVVRREQSPEIERPQNQEMREQENADGGLSFDEIRARYQARRQEWQEQHREHQARVDRMQANYRNWGIISLPQPERQLNELTYTQNRLRDKTTELRACKDRIQRMKMASRRTKEENKELKKKLEELQGRGGSSSWGIPTISSVWGNMTTPLRMLRGSWMGTSVTSTTTVGHPALSDATASTSRGLDHDNGNEKLVLPMKRKRQDDDPSTDSDKDGNEK